MCICGSRNVWVCAYVGFVMCGYVYVRVFNVLVCVCVGFLICGRVYMWVLYCACFVTCWF
jgi:hypothetical protein